MTDAASPSKVCCAILLLNAHPLYHKATLLILSPVNLSMKYFIPCLLALRPEHK